MGMLCSSLMMYSKFSFPVEATRWTPAMARRADDGGAANEGMCMCDSNEFKFQAKWRKNLITAEPGGKADAEKLS